MGATIKEKVKGSGKWFVYVCHEGRRKSALAGDKRTAEQIAREINRKILAGSFQLAEHEGAKTLREYGQIFLDHCTVKPSTKSDYISILNKHIYPAMGDQAIDKITRLDVKNFLKKKLATGLSRSTVDHFRAALSNVFDVALDDEAIDTNPASRLGRIVSRNQESHSSSVKPKFLTRDEIAALLAAFLKYRPEHYALAMVLARTGMRVGEAVALKWDDIDFARSIITVKRSKSRTIIDTPKSGKSRDVDMSNQLAEVLKDRRKETMKTMALRNSPWVFPGEKAETLDSTSWRRRVFVKMVEIAGLEPMRVHDLRHTYASLMIHQGQPLIYVQRQLGHHSIQITADTYSHLIPHADRGAVNALDDAVNSR